MLYYFSQLCRDIWHNAYQLSAFLTFPINRKQQLSLITSNLSIFRTYFQKNPTKFHVISFTCTVHTHVHIRTCTDTQYSHTDLYVCVHVYTFYTTLLNTHTYTDNLSHTRVCVHVELIRTVFAPKFTQIHIYIYVYIHTYDTYVHVHIYTFTQHLTNTHTHTRIYTHIDKCMYRCTHTYTHMSPTNLYHKHAYI